jgi:hypothetical protein
MEACRLLTRTTARMKVRLTRKLAEIIDGVSLEGARVGDVLDLGEREARLLIAEDWATDRERRRIQVQPPDVDRRRRESAFLTEPHRDGYDRLE